jgi:hypothetical protein
VRTISHEGHGKGKKLVKLVEENIKETVSWCIFLWSMMAWLRFMGLESHKENCSHAVASLVVGRMIRLPFVLF